MDRAHVQGSDQAWEEIVVIQQEEAERGFLEHRGEAEKLLHASRPVEWGFAGVHDDEGRHEENLWDLATEEIKRRGGGAHQAIRFRLWRGEPDFSSGQPAVFDPVPL